MFHLYVGCLALSGVAMVVLAAIGGRQSMWARIVSGVLGVGFLGYAFYLQFVFKGGHYVMFYYSFVLPVLLIVRYFKGAAGQKTVTRTGVGFGTPSQSPQGGGFGAPAPQGGGFTAPPAPQAYAQQSPPPQPYPAQGYGQPGQGQYGAPPAGS